ncbi:class I SAM-dependent methyltransferase [Nocardioides sp. T2.26MG-1]|uniref:class I SAM-dependent methyltransferase n=1 Tax=Nocardioides sp. T2.26MG-1 TaxID=3041166 RepID=UPI00253FD4EF|nr:class I SAM-dependent methyltransferase [Nocardioides sp. T2.26MG-1]
MSARVRLAAAVLAVVVVAVPIVFGLVDGTAGTLVGLAFSGLAILVAGCAYAVLGLVTRRLDRLERRLRKARSGKQSRRESPRGATAADQLRRERDQIAKRVQDLATLFEMVPIRAGLPALGLWTASADLLVELVGRLVEERPATVVEGGSGASTVVLALAAREHGITTRIVALEHDAAWAETTRALLARHGVSDYAEVRVAPLGPTSLEGHHTPWYDEAALADLSDIGLVLVDGPPEGTGPSARYPMAPLLRDRLAPRCTILVDDTDRPGDADVVARWRSVLPDFEFDTLHLDKGATVVTRS